MYEYVFLTKNSKFIIKKRDNFKLSLFFNVVLFGF